MDYMKEKLIISLSILIILVGVTYISSIPPRNVDTVEFETVLKGQYSGIPERDTFIINTKNEWNILLNKLQSGAEELEVEDINFEEGNYTFVIVTMGENQTTGYDIEIKEVYEYKDHIQLYVIREIPCAGCIFESKITRPFHIIKLSKTDKDIRR